ncbi:MAG: hypothetical protein RMK43_02105 [Cyclobacteriaceae bacterium]|nr:hypothetical protein [Cyclobacteriaceae bacterium]
MKTHAIILATITMLVIESAGQPAEWKQPLREIRLMRDNQTVAILTPDIQNKTAVLTMGENQWLLKLKQNGNRCIIREFPEGKEVAYAKGLGKKKGYLVYSDTALAFTRSGKKERLYKWDNGSTLRVKSDGIVSNLPQSETGSMMAQAAVLFNLEWRKYARELSRNSYYIIL